MLSQQHHPFGGLARAPVLVLALAALMLGPGAIAAPAVGAVIGYHGPAKTVAPHADDLGGLWLQEGTLENTVDDWRNKPTPDYNPEWKKVYDVQNLRAARGEQIERIERLCWPPGMPTYNDFIYPVEILMTPGQVTMTAEFYHQTRHIYTDGRKHPPADELEATFHGHSIGHWEGKTLVVETVGFRHDTYMRRPGWHSDQMRIVERIRRLTPDKLEWITTTEDPVALIKPWVVRRIVERQPAGSELREFVCAEEPEKREAYRPPVVPGLPLELRADDPILKTISADQILSQLRAAQAAPVQASAAGTVGGTN